MALLTISGEPASRWEEVAHGAARLLNFELVTESRLEQWMSEEFGDAVITDRAWRPAVTSILARMAVEHHLVVGLPGAEALFGSMPLVWRAGVVAPESRRIGNVMLDQRLERPDAKKLLATLDAEESHCQAPRQIRPIENRCRIVRRGAERRIDMEAHQMVEEVLHAAVQTHADLAGAGACCRRRPKRSSSFKPAYSNSPEMRNRPRRPRAICKARSAFGHPSEQMFANLLDFYRIQWDYEPRSFPLQWDKNGNVTEAFTPDFYLPEFDLYVELTTMKQALVTRTNRKVKRLRAIYPHVNIQVFYQKDFQDLVFKYGLHSAAGD